MSKRDECRVASHTAKNPNKNCRLFRNLRYTVDTLSVILIAFGKDTTIRRFEGIFFSIVLLFAIFICTPAMAKTDPKTTPRQEVTVNSVNLSAGDFFAAYFNSSEKDRVLFYLLGVLDTTEGKVWCNYKSFKTTTLRENIFEYLKKLPPERLNERASAIIAEVLSRDFPCGKRK